MKNQVPGGRKLALRKETVRMLDPAALGEVVGAAFTPTAKPTLVGCPTVKICDTTPKVGD